MAGLDDARRDGVRFGGVRRSSLATRAALLAALGAACTSTGPQDTPQLDPPILHEARPGTTRRPFRVLAGSTDGHAWALTAAFEPDRGKICVYLEADPPKDGVRGGCFWIEGSPAAVQPPSGLPRLLGYQTAAAPWAEDPWADETPLFIVGVTAAQVARVRVATVAGHLPEVMTQTVPDAGRLRFFALPLPERTDGTVTALDSDGNPLESQDFEAVPGLGPGTKSRDRDPSREHS